MKDTCQVRTRIAPSPTGYMHIGNLRTALYSFLVAKNAGGRFIVRIEDTDLKRYVEGATEAIFRALKWVSISHDEGPDIGGPHGPYIQSQRLGLYQKYAKELIDKGLAYYCFCDEKTLEEMRAKQIARKQAPKYDRRCTKLSEAEIKEKLAAGLPHVIRMKIPGNRVIEFNDLVRGKVSFNTNETDDQILLKSDGYPTYHLAVVVDDHLMEISHVTRTEEWLPSTPKHILLYEYFGWEPPEFAHLPLLLNPDKSKMSKRAGDVAVDDYIKKGYLPQAMVNYLAFLGWNPGTDKEIYSMDELIKDFSLEKIHKAGAVFNIEKLNWYNSYYIRQLKDNALYEKCEPFLPKDKKGFGKEQIIKMLNLEKERSVTLSEIGENIKFFFEPPEYDKTLLKWKQMQDEEIKNSLRLAKETILTIPDKNFNLKAISDVLINEASKFKNKGELLWPLRVALSGQKNSPPPFDIIEILGKEEGERRINEAIKKL